MADSGHGARAHQVCIFLETGIIFTWRIFRLQIALEPFEYLSESKGKGVRSKFVDAFNIWLKVPDDAVRAVKEAAEQLHMASLLYDFPGKIVYIHFLELMILKMILNLAVGVP